MPGLTAVGTLSYNGYTFDGTARITVEAVKVRDEADRTVLYEEITINVQAIVGGSGSDSNMMDLRKLLSQDGGVLVFVNKGFGTDLTVNSGQVRDVHWGPKTKILNWDPIGSNQTCEIGWQVTTCIPGQSAPNGYGSGTRYTGIMALNYEASFDIDHNGDTTRTITGYLMIAQTRQANSRTPPDSADNYRTAIAPVPPIGFDRKQRWNISKDKSRVDFTITDQQLPSDNPYPPGITEASGQHTASWDRNGNAAHFRNQIGVDFMFQRGMTGNQAWLMFVNIVKQRLAAAKARGQRIIMDTVAITDHLFSRRFSGRVGYHIITDYPDDIFKSLIQNNGLFTELGTDWIAWADSLLGSMLSARGTASLSLPASFDAIVDLQGPAPPTLAFDRGGPFTLNNPGPALLANEQPPPEQSFIKFDAVIEYESENKNARHSLLQVSPGDNAGSNYQNVDSVLADYDTNDVAGPPLAGKDDVIQVRTADAHTIVFKGSAIRAGYTIGRPNAATFTNARAVLKKNRFQTRYYGKFFGVHVHGAAWHQVYQVPNSPGGRLPRPRDVSQEQDKR